ncbi:MAG: glycosyltransferase, partial [Psychrosphaera sp.]|nr:glycosyltransferase [Psychrosphaera sp.]
GRLVEKKGIDTLIRAISLLHKQDQKIELFIAGSGPLADELASLVQQTGLTSAEVKFLGAMPHTQVADFIESLDVFVLPCKQDKNGDMDGIPVVLMEAMLSGVPVISTEISGIPELVINKETGLLVQPGNEHVLAEAMTSIINDASLKDVMIKQAVAKVRNEFSLKGNTEKLHTLFTGIVNKDKDERHSV